MPHGGEEAQGVEGADQHDLSHDSGEEEDRGGGQPVEMMIS